MPDHVHMCLSIRPKIAVANVVGYMKVAGLSKLEDGTHCDEARVLAEQKLCNVRAKLANLQRMVIVLQQPVEQRRKLSGTVRCPLIVALRTAGRIVGSYL